MKTLAKLIASAAVISLLAACSTNGTRGGAGPGDHVENTNEYGIDDQLSFKASKYLSPSELEAFKKNTYYFGYDKFAVDSQDDRAAILAHAKYLKANPNARVRIEGHTDERGTPEYNVALGERRSTSVTGLLKKEGVHSNQISNVSFGEEKPAMEGHDEGAWSQNRRSIIVYENQG